MSGVSRRNSLDKCGRPSRHRALNSLRRSGDRRLGMRPAQRRLESRQGVAQPQKGQSASGAADLVGLGGEVCIRFGFAADRFQQVGDAGRQSIGKLQGSDRANGRSDLLQAVSAQLGGHCKILSGSEAARSL